MVVECDAGGRVPGDAAKTGPADYDRSRRRVRLGTRTAERSCSSRTRTAATTDLTSFTDRWAGAAHRHLSLPAARTPRLTSCSRDGDRLAFYSTQHDAPQRRMLAPPAWRRMKRRRPTSATPTTSCSPNSICRSPDITKGQGRRRRHADVDPQAAPASTRRRNGRSPSSSTAARRARGRTAGATAGTPNCGRPRATSSPCRTRAAGPASARSSSTRSAATGAASATTT